MKGPHQHIKTGKNPKYFYDKSEFPFLETMELKFNDLKNELLCLLDNKDDGNWLRTFPDYVKSEETKAWKVFSFVFFQMRFETHESLCPKTAKIIRSIPEIISCDYSYLKPNTHILPHKGYSRMILRCHLPLVVPNGEKCSIRVGDETRSWEEGKLLIFDDSFDHEAWNNSHEERIVLMFDIPNPTWNYSATEISSYKIKNLEDPFLLSMASYDNWQKAYKNKKFPIERFD